MINFWLNLLSEKRTNHKYTKEDRHSRYIWPITVKYNIVPIYSKINLHTGLSDLQYPEKSIFKHIPSESNIRHNLFTDEWLTDGSESSHSG